MYETRLRVYHRFGGFVFPACRPLSPRNLIIPQAQEKKVGDNDTAFSPSQAEEGAVNDYHARCSFYPNRKRRSIQRTSSPLSLYQRGHVGYRLSLAVSVRRIMIHPTCADGFELHVVEYRANRPSMYVSLLPCRSPYRNNLRLNFVADCTACLAGINVHMHDL